MSDNYTYVFPAIRGVQSGREFYVSMCPLRVLGKLFTFDDEELVPELRAQRTLNKSRIPDLARYIVDNADGYTFSAITASIDGDVKFDAMGNASGPAFRMGTLTVPMSARVIVNDGQHRHAAIQEALRARPELADETIAVVFFLDRGLQRCQQMFADLNRHAVKPSASLGILYDHRNAAAQVVKHIGLTSNVFRNMIESERSTLSARSRKLFTLSALNFAVQELMSSKELENFQEASRKGREFWEAVGAQIPEWAFVRESKMTSGDVRRDFIHSHAIVLQALGRVGRAIYASPSGNLQKYANKLKKIDWSRKNLEVWEGRAMIGGGMSKSRQNVLLTANYIKTMLGLPLAADEQVAEDAFLRSRSSRKSKLAGKKS